MRIRLNCSLAWHPLSRPYLLEPAMPSVSRRWAKRWWLMAASGSAGRLASASTDGFDAENTGRSVPAPGRSNRLHDRTLPFPGL